MKITLNKQSSIKITGSKTIYFDPLDVKQSHDADYIFITHPHWDHFSILSILEVKKDQTVFITPRDLVEELLNIGIKEDNIFVVRPKEHLALKYLDIQTIPAYNIGKNYHKKEQEWVGYIVTIDEKTIYVAGDTDKTLDAKKVKCDLAFLPVGGTYTMDAYEASDLANTIEPKIVIPTHYNPKTNADLIFKNNLKPNIKCEILLGSEEHDI